jgi:hypothetical protein
MIIAVSYSYQLLQQLSTVAHDAMPSEENSVFIIRNKEYL